jgi:serine/threonine protein kinase
VIRIVDFESSYERARHANGETYNPPTTSGYSAPEVSSRTPDARADVFSLGAVLYTALAGYRWTDGGEVSARVHADRDIDAELKDALLAAVDPVPDNRYPSVQAFRAALATYLERIWPGRAW